ncbi:MAG: MATE family efflux transporter [Clostridiales bacterium]|nr:MATE family efflux transporter [Clostridiales bacterium]
MDVEQRPNEDAYPAEGARFASEEDEQRQKKYVMMTEEPVRRLVAKMAVPTIISMLITSFYSMADTFFVGQIGTSATAAVGVVFPLMAIVQATGAFFGQGSGVYISRLLGDRDVKGASRMAATAFFSALLFNLTIMAIGLTMIPFLATMLGSTPTILPHAEAYLRIILLGAPFLSSSIVLNQQLRLQGNAFYAMVGITIGAVVNIALDPLLIFVLDMGVAGAAIATSVSQAISFFVLLLGCTKGGSIPIKLKDFSPGARRYSEIIKAGIPSLSRQALGSLATIALNVSSAPYGDAAVAAMSIVGRIMMFSLSVALGFGQGFQPVCGFNYGAKRYDRVLDAFWFCIKVATMGLTVFAVLGLIYAPQIITAFRRDDLEVIQIGRLALRMQCGVFPLMGWSLICSMLAQNIGAYVSSAVLAFIRQGVLFLPLILILPRLIGFPGVLYAQPAADILTFLVSIPIGLGVLNKIKREMGGIYSPGLSENDKARENA